MHMSRQAKITVVDWGTAPLERPSVLARAGIGGGFRDEGEIARGGNASVHRIYDEDLKRRVALKILDEASSSEPSSTLRFYQEARLTAQLRHPGIPAVYALGVGARPYYMMEFVKGQTFARRVGSLGRDRLRPENLSALAEAVARVAEVLAHAHARGVVHRDLKPDNIMLGDSGRPYVIDWGVAMVMRPTEAPDGWLSTPLPREPEGTFVGTPCCMAPEQAHGRPDLIDARTDVFGLGGLLYFVLTGELLYPGGSVGEIARLAGSGRVLSPHLRSGEMLPFGLSAVAMRALSPKRSARYATALDFAQALRAAIRL